MAEHQNTSSRPSTLKKDAVHDTLKARILARDYLPGHKFPIEPQFAKELGVARITLRSAMVKLEKAGLVARVHGKGTFVRSPDDERKRLKKYLVLIENIHGSIEQPNTYIVPSIARVCEQLNAATDVFTLEFLRSLPEEHALRVMKEAGYSGVVLGASYFLGNEKEVRLLKALSLPVVIPHAKSTDGASTGFATLHVELKQAWIDSVRHLIQQGYTNIITIGAVTADVVRNLRGFEEREYLDFLAFEGANPDPALLLFAPYNYTGLTRLVSDAVKKAPSPLAILCFSDFYAMNVYDSLRSLSLRVPDDVAVMGYCGYPGGHMMSPPLSTVDFDYAGIGRRAMDILADADRWFGKTTPPQELSPHRLVVRESTARKQVV